VHRLRGRKLSLLIHIPHAMKVPYRRHEAFYKKAAVLALS